MERKETLAMENNLLCQFAPCTVRGVSAHNLAGKEVIDKMRNSKGFTLIELLVVILIIGILLALIIPNFVLFEERARRVSVKNDMHVVQTALEAWAVDHFGNYPEADMEPFVIDETPDEGGIAAYFPGGDPFGVSGSPVLGRFPNNPYTGTMYTQGSVPDMYYGDDFIDGSEPGEVANGDPNDPNGQTCDYDGFAAPDGSEGTIGVATYSNPNTNVCEEYGIVGYGRDISAPMYDRIMVSGSENILYFVLHN